MWASTGLCSGAAGLIWSGQEGASGWTGLRGSPGEQAAQQESTLGWGLPSS